MAKKINTPTLNLKTLADNSLCVEQGVEAIRTVAFLIENLPDAQVTPYNMSCISGLLSFISSQALELADSVCETVQDAMSEKEMPEGSVQ